MALDQQGVVIYYLRRGEKDGSVYGAIDFHGNDVPLTEIEKNVLRENGMPFTIYGGWAYYPGGTGNTLRAVNLNEAAERKPVAFPSRLQSYVYGATVDDRNGRMVAIRVENPHEEEGYFDERFTRDHLVLREFLLPAEANDPNGHGSWVGAMNKHQFVEGLLSQGRPQDRILYLTDNHCYIWMFDFDDKSFCYVIDLNLPRGIRNNRQNRLINQGRLKHLEGFLDSDFVFTYQNRFANNFATSSDNYFFVYDNDIWRGYGEETFPLRGDTHRWVNANLLNLQIVASRWHVWGIFDTHQVKRWSLEDGSEETITPPGLGALTHIIGDIQTYIPAGNKVWSYVTEPVGGQGDRVAPGAPATPEILSPGPNAVDDWTHWVSLGWEFVLGSVFIGLQVQRRVVGSGDAGWRWYDFSDGSWDLEERAWRAPNIWRRTGRVQSSVGSRFGLPAGDQGEPGVNYEFRFRFLGLDTQLWTGWTRTQRVNIAAFVEPPPAPSGILTTPYFARTATRDLTFEVTIPDGQTAIEVWLQRRPNLLTQGWEFWSGEDQLWLASSRGETPEPAATGAALTGEVAILVPAEWQEPDTTFYYSAYYRIAGDGAGKVSRASPEREISTDPDVYPEAPTLTVPTSGTTWSPATPLQFSVWCPRGQTADGWWVFRKRIDHERGESLWMWTGGGWFQTHADHPNDTPAAFQPTPYNLQLGRAINDQTTFEIELPAPDWADGAFTTYDYQVSYLSHQSGHQSELSAKVRVTAQPELSPAETTGSLWVRDADNEVHLYDWDFNPLPSHTVTDSLAFNFGGPVSPRYIGLLTNGRAYYHGTLQGTIKIRNLATDATITNYGAGDFEEVRGLAVDPAYSFAYCLAWERPSGEPERLRLLRTAVSSSGNLSFWQPTGVETTRNEMTDATERAYWFDDFADRSFSWRPLVVNDNDIIIENWRIPRTATSGGLFDNPIVTGATRADEWFPHARDDGSRNFGAIGDKFWWYNTFNVPGDNDFVGLVVAESSSSISASAASTFQRVVATGFDEDSEGEYGLEVSASQAWVYVNNFPTPLPDDPDAGSYPSPGNITVIELNDDHEPTHNDHLVQRLDGTYYNRWQTHNAGSSSLGFVTKAIVPVRPRGWNYATRNIERPAERTLAKLVWQRPFRDPSTYHPADALELTFITPPAPSWIVMFVARRPDGESAWEYYDQDSGRWLDHVERGLGRSFGSVNDGAYRVSSTEARVTLPAGRWGEDGRTYEFKARYQTSTGYFAPYSDIIHIEAFGRYRGYLPYAEIVRPRNNDDADGNNPLNLVVEIPYPHSVRSMLLKRTEVGGTTDEFWQAYSRDGTNGWVANENGVTSWHTGNTDSEGQVTIPLPAGWQTNGTSYVYQVKYEGNFEGDRRQQAISGFSPEHTINAVEGAHIGSEVVSFNGPHAPTWTTDGGFHDTTNPLKLEWVFHPNGAHTTQHEVRLARTNTNETETEWWSGSAWVEDVSSFVHTAHELTLAAGWQPVDTVLRYFVQVRAAADDSWSPPSNELEIVTGEHDVVLHVPVAGQTVGQMAQLNWGTSNQIAYQVVATRPWLPQPVLYDSGWVFGPERSARVQIPQNVRSSQVDLQVRVRDRFGRVSPWSVARCSVIYPALTPPSIAVTAAEGDDAVRINIDFTAADPAIVYSVERWQNFADGTAQAVLLDAANVSDEERNRVYVLADDVVPSGDVIDFYDRTARAGLPYAYRVRVVGSQERFAVTPWTTVGRPS